MRLALGLGLPFGGGGATGASALLSSESQGMALDFTGNNGAGQVAVKDTTTPANNKYNDPVDNFLTQSGTSPKLVLWSGGLYRWTNHNLFVNSDTPATQNVTVLITGATYTYGVVGSGSLAGTVGASGTASAGSPVTFVATGTSGTFTVTGSLTSMWINRGTVQTTPYHATGAAAWYGVPIRYNSTVGQFRFVNEPQATGLALWNRDLTNAVWTKSNVTAVKDQTGIDGSANSASSLLATANNGTALQAIVLASAAEIFAPFIKRITGTGAVSITLDGGATWTDITSQINSSTYVRVSATQTLANPSVGFKFATSADKIAVDVAGMEAGANATSPIFTFASTVTRARDNVGAANSTLPFSATAGSILISATLYASGIGQQHLWSFDDGTINEWFLGFVNTGSDSLNFYVADGGVASADLATAGNVTVNVAFKGGWSWTANDFKVVRDGGTVVPAVSGTLPTPTTFRLGTGANAIDMFGEIATLVYLPRTRTGADLIARTAP